MPHAASSSATRLSRTRPRRRAAPDQATRERVFRTAAELFAEHGFKRVTVRQIAAEAGANVAAVNYHFGDKAGLYAAIVDEAIAMMRETGTLARQAGEGLEPREQLRAFVRVFMTRVMAAGRPTWIHRLMTREMDNPTDFMTRVVREVMEPRATYLGGIVAALTGIAASDPRVLRIVASIQGQVFVFVRPMPAKLPAAWKSMLLDVDAAVDHITTFSLGGMRAIDDVSR